MTEDQVDEFTKALRELVDKYEIADAAFCGTYADKSLYLGTFVKEKMTISELGETVQNIGRLWQHAREQMRISLNRFDTWGGKR